MILTITSRLLHRGRKGRHVLSGQPIIAHWSSPDPAIVEGSDEEKYRAFKQVAFQINRRLQLFTLLPFEKIDRLKLATLTREIGTKEKEPGTLT